MINRFISKETQNWTEISSYRPSPVSLIVIIIIIIPLFFVPLYFIDAFSYLEEDIFGPVFFILILIIYLLTRKNMTPSGWSTKIVLFEEGLRYYNGIYSFTTPWKDIKEIKLLNKMSDDIVEDHIYGATPNIIKRRSSVKPSLSIIISTNNESTQAISGRLRGKYILPQEIKQTDLSARESQFINEHCANLLYCIKRRAYNAKWTGDISGIDILE